MRVTGFVLDASVVLKWFLDEDDEATSARALPAAVARRGAAAWILDLTLYEVANRLIRSDRADALVAAELERLREVCRIVDPDPDARRRGVALARRHGLTFYDAMYGAVAEQRGAVLVTTDRDLLRAGLGELPSVALARL